MKIHLGPRDDYLGATNVRVADSVLVGGRVGLSGTLCDVVGDDGVAGGKKGKLLLLQQLSFWLVCVIGGAVVVVVMRLCIDWFVAFVITFLDIREVPQFVSLVLFRQVFGVECWGAVVVVRRHGADETRVDPLGRGEGRGAPHEIHVRRLQGLG